MMRMLPGLMVMTLAIPVGAEVLPDPTRPYGYGIAAPIIIEDTELPQAQIDWKLTGVRISTRDKSAILNGRLVREGDNIDGAVLLEIHPASVLIEFDEQRIRVNLLKVNIKKDKAAQTKQSDDQA